MRIQDHRYYQRVSRPIGAMAKSCPNGYCSNWHHHPRAQFLYAQSGTMKVTTDLGIWVIPPDRAVWLPPYLPHQTDALSAIELRTLYIRKDACPKHAPQTPCILSVSPLLRELVRRATEMTIEYDELGHEGKIMTLLLDEISWPPPDQLPPPALQDERLIRIEQSLRTNPGSNRTLASWASDVGASERTLARLFLKETGLSFSRWRDQHRATAASLQLVQGVKITSLASDFGYETPGAFTAMFRRAMGMTPSQYLAAHPPSQTSGRA